MRTCFMCDKQLPPESEHYVYDAEIYCTDCLKAEPYTAYVYYLDGDYIGDSEGHGDVEHVESYDDEYEEGETP